MSFELALALSTALRWLERLLGFAVSLQTLELLLVRDAWADTGVFRWATLRREFRGLPRPLRALLDSTLSSRAFTWLLVLQLCAALTLVSCSHALLAPFLLLTILLVCIRFRGSYNGGSDAMTVVLLTALSVARLSPSPIFARAGLAYAAGQLTLSYFVAGVSKLREPSWRTGQALPKLLRAAPYRARAPRFLGIDAPKLGWLSAWLVIGFECTFPLAWLEPRLCLVMLGCALCFHLVNARLLGLNRFVWVWLAAYPALLYWSIRLHDPWTGE